MAGPTFGGAVPPPPCLLDLGSTLSSAVAAKPLLPLWCKTLDAIILTTHSLTMNLGGDSDAHGVARV